MKLPKWMIALLGAAALAFLCIIGALGIDLYVVCSTAERILSPQDAAAYDADCILVLGCLVKADGTPSNMLHDRLQRGVELLECGAGKKLLMSGDHGRVEYNEVKAMKEFATSAGVASEDVFLDHAGFSTYESLYRAKEVFGAKKVVIVTQKYHLYRALYIAEHLGLEAVGVAADYRSYTNQFFREVREVLARDKDFLTSIFQPTPTYLGETISLDGDGNITNGE